MEDEMVAIDDMEAVFRLKKANDGIRAVCGVMDDLGLTLIERHHVLKCLYLSSKAIMDSKREELVSPGGEREG